MNTPIPVLLYHSISDGPESDRFSVPADAFAEHLALIADSRRTSVTVSELAAGLRRTAELPQRCVCLTFDDGYPDSRAAIELACEMGIRSTLYVTTSWIDTGQGVSSEDLAAIAALPGVEIGAHCIHHLPLDELSRARAMAEIAGSRRTLEDLLGQNIASFAYPHGYHDTKVRAQVIEAGFDSAAAVKNVLSHPNDDPWAIARWTVERTTSADKIAQVLSGTDLPIVRDGQLVRTRAFRAYRRIRRRLVDSARPTESPTRLPDKAPIAVAALDLADDATTELEFGTPRVGGTYHSALVMVRVGGRLLGWIQLPFAADGGPSSEEILAAAHVAFPEATRSALPADRPLSEDPISIIIPTCADAAAVVRSVEAVLARGVGEFEIIVVENRPHGSPVREALVARFGERDDLVYIEENHRGLSWARNAGVGAAVHEWVAFIDDDIFVDEHWMVAIRAALAARPDVDCITGLILPLELETQPQLELERFATFGKGFFSRSFSAAEPPGDMPLFPYTSGAFGSGANTIVRRTRLVALGGFDRVLGAGTASRGAEELDLYVRLIEDGATILYDPGVCVWHRHPDTVPEIRQRAYGMGVGVGAMLTKHLTGGAHRRRLLALVPGGVAYWFNPQSRKREQTGLPSGRLDGLELAGLAVGPVAYAASVISDRRSTVRNPARPIWSGEIELTSPRLPSVLPKTRDGRSFAAARILVRLQGACLGFVQLDIRYGRLSVDRVLARVGADLQPRLELELGRRGLSGRPLASLADDASGSGEDDHSGGPLVSIAVCTRNRPTEVSQCIAALLALADPDFELLIVENAPSDAATRKVVDEFAAQDPRVKYQVEPRAGLSRARNTALRHASGELIAYVDDDVIVDSRWLTEVRHGFRRRDDVGCVTGLIASASLERPSEQYFDGRVSWSSSCEHRLYTPEPSPGDSALYPYSPGTIGAGANIAFVTSALREIGGFDERLGAGTPAAGGEDLDIFVRLLRAGRSISYEPSALVWHAHRVDESLLRTQMRGYGSGLTAYLAKYLISPVTRGEILRRGLAGLGQAGRLSTRSRDSLNQSGVRAGVAGAEIQGMLSGPWLYLRTPSPADGPAHEAPESPARAGK